MKKFLLSTGILFSIISLNAQNYCSIKEFNFNGNLLNVKISGLPNQPYNTTNPLDIKAFIINYNSDIISRVEKKVQISDSSCWLNFDYSNYFKDISKIKSLKLFQILLNLGTETYEVSNIKFLCNLLIDDSIKSFIYKNEVKPIFSNNIEKDANRLCSEKQKNKPDSIQNKGDSIKIAEIEFDKIMKKVDSLSDKLQSMPKNDTIFHKIDFIFSNEDSINKLNTTFSNPSSDTIHYTIKTLIDEEKLADNLAPQINYLNMDTYIGVGGYYFMNENEEIDFKFNEYLRQLQPINLCFETRLNSNQRWQPVMGGEIQTYATNGIMLEVNYGRKFCSPVKKNTLSIQGFIQTSYLDISDSIFSDSVFTDGSKKYLYTLKSYYEGEFGIKISYNLNLSKDKYFGLSCKFSYSIPDFNRTNTISIAGSNKNLVYYGIDSYVNYFSKKFLFRVGIKKYFLDIDSEADKELESSLEGLNNLKIYAQFFFRLNSN